MNKEDKSFVEALLAHGARSMKISKKQEMKLRECILPKLIDELEVGGKFYKISDIRKYIDSWESEETEGEKYYYVDKNSDGKSLWDLI